MKKLILFFGLIFLLSSNVFGQNERFKALFLYNFTKYVEWPSSQNKGNFTIGVLGNSDIIQNLNIIAKRKKVGSQKIIISEFKNINDLKSCHILYVTSGKSKDLKKILSKYGENTLIITESKGLAKKGAGINYFDNDGNLSFEINKKNITNKGLKLDESLISLGKEVK